LFYFPYNFYNKAISDISYVEKRYEGRVPTTPEYSTKYYYLFFFISLLFPVSMLLMIILNRIFSKDIKVKRSGIIIQLNQFKREETFIKYTEINFVSSNEDTVTITYNENKIIFALNRFDDIYQFNNFCSIVYENYKEAEKTV
jgi:hypothetical protein